MRHDAGPCVASASKLVQRLRKNSQDNQVWGPRHPQLQLRCLRKKFLRPTRSRELSQVQTSWWRKFPEPATGGDKPTSTRIYSSTSSVHRRPFKDAPIYSTCGRMAVWVRRKSGRPWQSGAAIFDSSSTPLQALTTLQPAAPSEYSFEWPPGRLPICC